MNLTILTGFVGQDPECKTFDNGNKVAQFSLATSERYKDKSGEVKTETQWHNIVIWGKLAEIAEKYVKKGHRVSVTGKIKYETYQSDGVTKYITKIIVSTMEMLTSKNEGGQKPQTQTTQTTQAQPTQPDEPDNDYEETDDLPFN